MRKRNTISFAISQHASAEFREQARRDLGDGVKVVSQEESEAAGAVLCIRKGEYSPFTDNEEGVCILCLHAVVFRPTSPKKPPRICSACLPRLRRMMENGETLPGTRQ